MAFTFKLFGCELRVGTEDKFTYDEVRVPDHNVMFSPDHHILELVRTLVGLYKNNPLRFKVLYTQQHDDLRDNVVDHSSVIKDLVTGVEIKLGVGIICFGDVMSPEYKVQITYAVVGKQVINEECEGFKLAMNPINEVILQRLERHIIVNDWKRNKGRRKVIRTVQPKLQELVQLYGIK